MITGCVRKLQAIVLIRKDVRITERIIRVKQAHVPLIADAKTIGLTTKIWVGPVLMI
jgi:hypothetical protein